MIGLCSQLFPALIQAQEPSKELENNSPLSVLGIEDVRIQSQVNGDWHDGMIHGVLFVPDLGMALFSIGEATDRGMKATFDNTGVTITKGEKTVATGVRINKHLYRMKMKLFTQVVYLQHAPRYNCGMSASDT